jgi:endogenous inhibitor of DNA gyrase (YacG/DUF329 family)
VILPNQSIKVKWVGANRKHYESLGYVYTKLHDELIVPIEHLSSNSHEIIKVKCDNCNKILDKRYGSVINSTNHFCNAKCRGIWETRTGTAKLRGKSRKTSIETNCKVCGKVFDKKPSEFKGHGEHYCSRSCVAKDTLVKHNPNPKKDKKLVKCDHCGNEYEVNESKVKTNKWHFCSRYCYATFRSENLFGDKMYNYQDIKTKCTVCDKEYKTYKWGKENNKDKFCSQECYYKFRSMYYVGEKHPQFGVAKTPEQIEHMRIVTANRIANGEFPQTNTSIQIKIKEIVDELSMNFEEEIPFKYYVLDFYNKENCLGIEVMGDYWHANPIKYKDYDSLHDIQKKDVIRDKSKNTYLKKYHNVNILYLWEKDINDNPELCKKLIIDYVKNNGILKDYNSYNYILSINNLKLNKNIILPYFMRANTIYQKSSN